MNSVYVARSRVMPDPAIELTCAALANMTDISYFRCHENAFADLNFCR
jgi:hypothetical protein